MLFALLLNPAVVLFASVLGAIICRLLGIDPHAREMVMAAGVCLLAAETGVIPLVWQRTAQPAVLFQAGFAGTVLHLAMAALLGAATLFCLKPGPAFVYWLLAMYWVTLIALCVVIVKRLRLN